MYRTDNDRIGEYLTELISKSKYKNARQFGIAYLELRDGAENVDETAISNIQNRLSQIKQGNKGIQIEDLPFFAEMLGVSIEEILSAGTAIRPANNRKTNYSIAFSDNPK